MEQKVALILGSVVATGMAAACVILAVRMPQEAAPAAFTACVNATARGLANAVNSAC